MLLNGYTKEIFRPKCNPRFRSVHCIAHLEEDIREVLPYLNTVLGGSQYCEEPPSLTIKAHGRLITLHAQEIAINALEGEAEAEKILQWLRMEINEAWENRHEIQPTFSAAPKPKVLEILKLLPRTNCRKCGQPTCTVFALLVVEGAKGSGDCQVLGEESRNNLWKYLDKFGLDKRF